MASTGTSAQEEIEMFGYSTLMITMLSWAFAQQAGVAPASIAQASPYHLEVSLALYKGDQITARAAGGSESQVQGTVWMDATACAAGAGSGVAAPVSMPATRWQYTAAVVGQSGSDATVDVTWQRTGDAAGEAQHRQVTLRL